MHCCLVTPAPARSLKGNRITAVRWARILRSLGHRVSILQQYDGRPGDLLIALHARRSAASVERFARERPGMPLIVALTGTDLYEDIRTSRAAQRSLELATRLIVLQALAPLVLPRRFRAKTRVIHQSVAPPARTRRPARAGPAFDVCVLGHLRPVKDPFRAAMAARLLPPASRIRITHVGAALSEAMAARARSEQARNPRYRWLGELSRGRALRVLARSDLMALTSRMEGGANAVSEAIALGIPVISSRIAGSVGILGKDYPGYFSAGDTVVLAKLLRRAEAEATFRAALSDRIADLAPLVTPARERQAWKELLKDLFPSHGAFAADLGHR